MFSVYYEIHSRSESKSLNFITEQLTKESVKTICKAIDLQIDCRILFSNIRATSSRLSPRGIRWKWKQSCIFFWSKCVHVIHGIVLSPKNKWFCFLRTLFTSFTFILFNSSFSNVQQKGLPFHFSYLSLV